jgi:hypothetical protein
MLLGMSRPLVKVFRVLTKEGPDVWLASRLQDLLERVRRKEEVVYIFIVYMRSETGSPRAWGPSSSSVRGSEHFALLERPSPLRPAEADEMLECIELAAKGETLQPRTRQPNSNLEGANRVQQAIQGAFRAVFGKKADRPFEMFEVVRARRGAGPHYRFVPEDDDYLVVLGEEFRSPDDAPAPSVAAVVGESLAPGAEVPEFVTESSVQSTRAERPARVRSPKRSKLAVSLGSAWDLHEGSIDVAVNAENVRTVDNGLGKFRATVAGQRLACVGAVVPRKVSYQNFLRPPTSFLVRARRQVSKVVQFAIPSGVSFPRGSRVVVDAVDLDGARVRVSTRLFVERPGSESTEAGSDRPRSTPR